MCSSSPMNTHNECSICYTDFHANDVLTLHCGHSYHKDCIKSWYLKGSSGTSCPMCRKPICFKHSNQVLKKWVDERKDTLMNDAWNTEIDELLESYNNVFQEILEDSQMVEHGMWTVIAEELFDELVHYEETFRKCRDAEEFEWIVNDPTISHIVEETINLPFIDPHKKHRDNLFVGKNNYGVVMSICGN